MSDPISMSGVPVVRMPPIPREPFATDADYERAVATSQATNRDVQPPTSDVFIPEAKLVEALVALVNNHHAVGMGVLHDHDIDEAEASGLVSGLLDGTEDRIDLDYVHGRPIKLKPLERVTGGFQFTSDLYNRDAPAMTAEEVVAQVVS